MAYVKLEDVLNIIKEQNCNNTGIIQHIKQHCHTAELEEVKHGEWVDKFNNKYYNQVYVCSECGEKAYIKFVLNELGNTTYTQALTPFCPTCGADMRGGKNDL